MEKFNKNNQVKVETMKITPVDIALTMINAVTAIYFTATSLSTNGSLFTAVLAVVYGVVSASMITFVILGERNGK